MRAGSIRTSSLPYRPHLAQWWEGRRPGMDGVAGRVATARHDAPAEAQWLDGGAVDVLCPLPAQRQVMRGEARLAYTRLNAKRGVTVGVQGLRGASLFKCCVAPSLLLGYERLQGGTMRKPPCDHEWVVDYATLMRMPRATMTD
jgi:hypothetical protein